MEGLAIIRASADLFQKQEEDETLAVYVNTQNVDLTTDVATYKDQIGKNYAGVSALEQLEQVASRDWGSLAYYSLMRAGNDMTKASSVAGWNDGMTKYFYADAIQTLLPSKYSICLEKATCDYKCMDIDGSGSCETSNEAAFEQTGRKTSCSNPGRSNMKLRHENLIAEQWERAFQGKCDDGAPVRDQARGSGVYRYTATYGYLCAGNTDTLIAENWLSAVHTKGFLREYSSTAEFVKAAFLDPTNAVTVDSLGNPKATTPLPVKSSIASSGSNHTFDIQLTAAKPVIGISGGDGKGDPTGGQYQADSWCPGTMCPNGIRIECSKGHTVITQPLGDVCTCISPIGLAQCVANSVSLMCKRSTNCGGGYDYKCQEDPTTGIYSCTCFYGGAIDGRCNNRAIDGVSG
jgi:hypothetical protein